MSRVELHSGILTEARPDPRDIVGAYQRDLVRVAFVLTGDDEISISLADGAFLEVLTADTGEDDDPQSWSLLLGALGRLYLAGEDAGAATRGALPDDLERAADERARLRQALELLTRPMRAALVLRDLGGLNARDAAALAGYDPEEFDAMLGWSRERVREASGYASSESPQRLLAALAVNAPRVDLWPDLAPALDQLVAHQRRRSRRLLIVTLALLLAILLASALWFLGGLPVLGDDGRASAGDNVASPPSPSPAPTRPPRPTATPAPTPTSVELINAALGSDLQVRAVVYGDFNDVAEEFLFSYDPKSELPPPARQASHALEELRPSTYVPFYLSPDGQWTVLSRERQEDNLDTDDPNDFRRVTMLSVARDGEEQAWEYELPYFSNTDSAVLGDTLYVAVAQDGPPTLFALNLWTGEVINSAVIELPIDLRNHSSSQNTPSVVVQLFPFPEAGNSKLYVFAASWEIDGVSLPRWSRVIYRAEPDSLQLELINSATIEGDSPGAAITTDFDVWSAQLLPDGSGLYQVIQGWTGQQPGVRVLDFESGLVDELQISFSPALAETSNDGTQYQTVASNDGRRVYVLSERTGEVAVVDLTALRVERMFPLDPGGVASGPINVSWSLLSHDGRWLYLVGDVSAQWEWSNQSNQSIPPERNTVWAVDLTTWRVAHRFEVSGGISSIYLDPNGAEFHVISQVRNLAEPAHLRFLLMSFDAATWDMLDSIDLSELASQDAQFSFRSTTITYRDTYGRASVVDGIEPSDVEEYTTLPRVEIIVSDEALPVGITLPVEVAFINPATNEPLTNADPRVRFDPGQFTTLVFEQPGAKSLVTVSAEIAPGQQQGTIRLKAPGVWDARIIVGDDESGFTLVLQDVFRGVPTFEGDDGRPYALRLETDPDEPIPAGEVFVRAVFVDAETGEPIPDGVMLLDGMPEEMDIALSANSVMTRDLDNAGHGVYESTITISEPGAWRARLIFRQPEASEPRSIQIEVGALHVVESSSLDALVTP